jgi:NitT/TauT family transport system permease protein
MVRPTLHRLVRPVAGAIVILLLWQFGLPHTNIPAYALPVPSAIAVRLDQTFVVLVSNLGVTASTTLLGLALALIIGVLLALLVIFVPAVNAVLVPVLAAFNGVPKIAIAPLFIIWFGLGLESKILLAFLLALFPIFVNALSGLTDIEADVFDLARLAGGTTTRIFLKVRLMNALPYIVDGLKVGFPLALVGSIVGEFIGGNRGIGHLILSGQFNLDTPLVFAAILLISLFTTSGIAVIALFEKRFLGWRPSRRQR